MSAASRTRGRSRSLQNFYSCRCGDERFSDGVFPFFTKFLLLQIFEGQHGGGWFPFFTKFLLLQIDAACGRGDSVPVLYKISTLVDAGLRTSEAAVPVLYKISTLVDSSHCSIYCHVPVLYKISTLVDQVFYSFFYGGSRSLQNFFSCRSRLRIGRKSTFPFFTKFLLLQMTGGFRVERGSRSLQNFYSCRFLPVLRCAVFPFFTKFLLLQIAASTCWSRQVPVLYKISTLVDSFFLVRKNQVPVLYKISTLVDLPYARRWRARFPFFTKFLLLQIAARRRCEKGVPVLYKISTLVDPVCRAHSPKSSRSLQNFYSCRLRARAFHSICSRSLQNF